MKLNTAVFFLSALALLTAKTWAIDLAPTPPAPARAPASFADGPDPVYEEPGTANTYQHIRNKDGYDGARVQFYYDPLSGYSKLLTNNQNLPALFGYQTTTGNMSGVQAMWSVWAPSDFEFQTGLDYVFPVSVQGQQNTTAFSSYTVNSQTLSIVGFKVLQVGYRINMADFTLAPYGGIGVYYGKNAITFQTTTFPQSNNNVTYTKLMMVYTAGARLDYNFNRKRTIAAGVGVEFFVPTKITDQLSQDGSIGSEFQGGNASYLQANMDFLTGIGARLYAGVAAYF
ncbi:MAG: hypothetical protein ACXVA9_05205 [Bdellovibrionales bacterium]